MTKEVEVIPVGESVKCAFCGSKAHNRVKKTPVCGAAVCWDKARNEESVSQTVS